jgi:hypothetical protein
VMPGGMLVMFGRAMMVFSGRMRVVHLVLFDGWAACRVMLTKLCDIYLYRATWSEPDPTPVIVDLVCFCRARYHRGVVPWWQRRHRGRH